MTRNEFTSVFIVTTSKVLRRMSNAKSTGCSSRSSTPKNLLKEHVSQNRISAVPTIKVLKSRLQNCNKQLYEKKKEDIEKTISTCHYSIASIMK